MSYTEVPRHPRYTYTAFVDVTVKGTACKLRTENVSLRGAFVRSSSPLPPGTPVDIVFHVLGTTLPVCARVIHVIDEESAVEKGHPPGMGLAFVDAPGASEAAWEEFMERVVQNATASWRKAPKPVNLPE